LPVSIGDFASY